MPRSPAGHVPAEKKAQFSERRDVELKSYIHGAFDRCFQEFAVQAVSGIVH